MEEDECVVCLESGSTVSVHPCRHLICRACMLAWLAQDRFSCPMCRQHVFGLGEDDESEGADEARTVRVVFHPNTHAGITLKNDGRQGVRVTVTENNDRVSASGFRKGDVITHLNSLPVNDHKNAVAFFNHAADKAEICVVEFGIRNGDGAGHVAGRVWRMKNAVACKR